MWAYGNVRALLMRLSYVCIQPGDSHYQIEKRATEKVFRGKVLVCSYQYSENECAAVIPLRFGSPRILVVTGWIKRNLGPNLDRDPSPLARLWRYKFDPRVDLVLSVPKSRSSDLDKIIEQLSCGTYPNLASWRRKAVKALLG